MARLGLRLLAIAALAVAAHAIQYQHDELAWTKQLWPEYKLDFPFSEFADREADVLRALAGPAKGLVETTLGGPDADLQALIEEDLARVKTRPSSFDVAQLDDGANVDAAVGVSQCKVCLELVSALWRRLVPWVQQRWALPGAGEVRALGEALCESEVPTAVLKEWVLLRAKVNPPGAFAKAPPAGAAQEFYLLSQRQRQHATPAEIAVVQVACKALLQTKEKAAALPAAGTAAGGAVEGAAAAGAAAGAAAPAPPPAPAAGDAPAVQAAAGPEAATVPALVLSQLEEYHRLMLAQRPGAGPAGRVDPGGPRPERSCHDRHPQCEYWAELGECAANPNYMVGPSKAVQGWCRRACKACTPPAPPPAPKGWTEEDITTMREMASDMLGELQTAGCTSGDACRWSADGGGQAALAAAAGGGGGESAREWVLREAAMISGPVRPAGEPMATVDPATLKASEVVLVRPAAEALVASSRVPPGGVPPPGGRDSPAARALWEALHGRCIYANGGYWYYELCYLAAASQFHLEPQTNAVDWEIRLGRYGAADWAVRPAADAALFPPGATVPYVSQELGDGAECELTEEGGGAGEEAVGVAARAATLRFMCSPDASMHVGVREPRQCRYVLDVYVPALCGVEGMAPSSPGTKGGGAAAQGGGGEGDDDDDDDDDPYVDPDDLDDSGRPSAVPKDEL